jgi:transketolase
VLDRSQYGAAQGIERGGYVVREAPDAVGTIIATGSEVSLALAATEILDSEGLPFQVVNLASWEIFAQQDPDYQAQVLPDLPTLSLEAAATFGWERYADRAYGIDSFGASGPGGAVYQSFGFTPEAVASACREILG